MTSLLARILTRSFPGKAPSLDEARPGKESQSPDSATQAAYESRAFALWLEQLMAMTSPRVFELGKLHSSTLGCLSSRGMGLSVLGLGRDKLSSIEAEISTFAGPTGFSGALCWDIPNYLDEEQLRFLGEWLAEQLNPNGVLLTCLATQVPYPDRPGQYSVVDGETLCFEPDADGCQRTFRLNNADLTRAWPRFETVRSFLLRNGMQEYVLKRRQD